MEETVAGPSQSPSHPVNLQTLDLIDVDGFDWKVFESTYKGTLSSLTMNINEQTNQIAL